MSTLDSQSDSALRRDGATVAITFTKDEPTTPPTIARIVRRHDGGTTVRVRVLGELATRLVLIRELTSARAATRPEINAAIAAKTSEQIATGSASQSSPAAASSGPTSTAPTSRAAMGAGRDVRTGLLHPPASNSARDVGRAETRSRR